MKVRGHFRLFLTIGIFLSLCAVYLFKLNLSFHVNSDFGRDIFEMQKIIGGDFTLIGPMLSVGLFSSPLYFYFYAPILAIFQQNPWAIIYANAIIFSLSFSLMFYFLSYKRNLINTFFFVLIIALLPQTIYSARYPGNAFSYIPFILPLLFFPFINSSPSKKSLFILGVLSFICLSFHPTSIIGIFPLMIWLTISQRKKIFNLIYYFIPTVSFILPVVIFEIKHNFLITSNFTYRVSANLLPANNLNFLKQTISTNFSTSIFLIIVIGTILFFRFYKKYTLYEKILTFWTILSFVVLIFILPKHDWSYLVSLNILLAVSLFISFSKTRYSILLISVLILLIVSSFPKYVYIDTVRPLSRFEKAAAIIASNFPDLCIEKFNVIQVDSSSILVPVGHEYRFFLNKLGFVPLPETNYSEANKLVIFSEIGELNVKSIHNWEIDQFGTKYTIINHSKEDDLDIYFLSK